MKYYIYQLTYENKAFYLGRTINPTRRHNEHKRNSINGTELKYQFIREIGDDWTLDVIAEYSDSKYNYEDHHIYQALCRGCSLTNMMKGSIYDEANDSMLKGGKVYKNDGEFFAHRSLVQQQLADAKIARNLRKKQRRNVNIDSYTDRTIFINDMGNKPTESKGVLAARAKSQQKTNIRDNASHHKARDLLKKAKTTHIDQKT